ncbi:hypothetical protein MACJ_000567 [Theileria orientalis]|uniref:Uncharacterized protein n=1 Tax=Theileria orientalis TaxID=68886 RepID=A0A976M495_THEOR|nr:hypothetical protein MACJ_000567 [Theileria orientalis]
MSARWDWASSITEYVITGDLITNLKDQYKKLLRNRTIQFVKAEKESDDVLGYQQEIGKDKKKYRIICTPSGEKSVLNSNCLFTFNTKLKDKYEEPKIQPGCQKPQDNGKNQIDPYFLAPVYGKYFDGIIIYFARDSPKNEKTIDEKHDANTALYLEFIDLREKDICFKRKDKNGYLWAEEKIDYKDDTALESQLGTICTALNDEVNTCILDMKESYKGPTVKTEETTQAYIKYTHTYSKENKCTFIFGRKETEIPKLKGNSLKTACVEVYYLKAKDKEDDEPFLVSFEVKESQPKTKAYHFKNDGEFKNWVEFVNKKKEKPEKEQQDDLKNELKERLGELATSGSCSPNLFWLRIVAYQILTYEKPSPAPPVTVPEEKKRPDLYKPEDVPDPPPLEWIITGSVGGVVFVGSSAVGYGVYWYNTTIRLLT